MITSRAKSVYREFGSLYGNLTKIALMIVSIFSQLVWRVDLERIELLQLTSCRLQLVKRYFVTCDYYCLDVRR